MSASTNEPTSLSCFSLAGASRPGIVIALLGALMPGCGARTPPPADADRFLAVMAETTAAHRRFEPTFTGFSDRGPCPGVDAIGSRKGAFVVTCARPPEPGTREFRRLRRLGEGLNDSGGRAEAASVPGRVSAIWTLYWSDDAESADRAVDWLEEESAAARSGPETWNDLAVAYLIRAERVEDPLDLLRAAESALRALELKPGFVEARGNLEVATRALGWSAQQLNDARQSIAGWKLFAARLRVGDPAALAEVENVARSGFAQQLRELALEELLGSWAEAELRNDSIGSARTEATIAAIGDALVSYRGESILVEELRSLRGGRPAERHERALGYRELGRGFAAVRSFDYGAADQALSAAAKRLRPLGAPVVKWLDYYRGVCAYFARDLDRAARAFDDAIAAAAGNPGWRSLEGRGHWSKGATLAMWGRTPEGVAEFKAGGVVFEEIDERENLAGIDLFLVQILQEYGRSEEAVGRLIRVQKSNAWITTPVRRQNQWLNWSRLAETWRLPRVHGLLAKHVASSALEVGDALARFNALLDQAKAAQSPDRQERLLAEAKDELGQIADPAVRRQAAEALDLEASKLLARRSPREAELAATRAYEAYSRIGMHFACDALIARGTARMQMGQFGAAAEDLELAFRELAVHRARARDPIDRALFLEGIDAAVASWTELAWQTTGNWRDFWAHLAERRAIWRPGFRAEDSKPDPGESKPTVEGLQALLAPGEAVVEFAVLPSRLLVFTVGKSAATSRAVDVSIEDLGAMVGRLTRLLARGDEQWQVAADELRGLLFGDEWRGLESLDRLSIVPDDVLFEVPFEAILGRGSVSPSRAPALEIALASWRHGRRSARRSTESTRRAVLLVNPSESEELFPGLPSLRAAEDLVARSARQYESSTVLTGAAGTLERLEAALERTDPGVVELSTHSLPGRNRNAGRFLLLAPSASLADGMLDSNRLAQLRLVGVPTVILAGCRTAATSPRRGGDTPFGLAVAALEAGASHVIASLSDLDDAASAEVLAALHERLAAGVEPVEAVSQALGAAGRARGAGARNSMLGLHVVVPESFASSRRALEP